MLLLVFAVLVTIICIHAILKRKYNIEEDPVPLRQYSNTDKWIQQIFSVGFVILLAVIYFVLTPAHTWLLLGFALIFVCYRTFIEYKYDKEEKGYLLSLVSTFGLVVLLLGSIYYGMQYIAPYKEAEQQLQLLNPESIQQIEIVNYGWNENARDILEVMKFKGEVTVGDKQLVTLIINALSKTELLIRDVKNLNRENYYRLSINGDRNFEITIYDDYLTLNTGEVIWFKVKGTNGLYELLKEEQLEWQDPEI